MPYFPTVDKFTLTKIEPPETIPLAKGYNSNDYPPHRAYADPNMRAGVANKPFTLGFADSEFKDVTFELPSRDGRSWGSFNSPWSYDAVSTAPNSAERGALLGYINGRLWNTNIRFRDATPVPGQDPKVYYTDVTYEVSQKIDTDPTGILIPNFSTKTVHTINWSLTYKVTNITVNQAVWSPDVGGIWPAAFANHTQDDYIWLMCNANWVSNDSLPDHSIQAGGTFLIKMYTDATTDPEPWYGFRYPDGVFPTLESNRNINRYGTVVTTEGDGEWYYTLIWIAFRDNSQFGAGERPLVFKWRPTQDLNDYLSGNNVAYIRDISLSNPVDDAAFKLPQLTTPSGSSMTQGPQRILPLQPFGALLDTVYARESATSPIVFKMYTLLLPMGLYGEGVVEGIDDTATGVLASLSPFEGPMLGIDSTFGYFLRAVSTDGSYPYQYVLGTDSPILPSSGDAFIRAWTYTLDGHDFYVLALGHQGTLVYDTYSQQWSEWASPDSAKWALNTGANWLGSIGVVDGDGQAYGSNVIVGDDTTGDLYFLDPEKIDDDLPRSAGSAKFQRVATTQIGHRGKNPISCDVISLTGDYQGDESLTVSLEYSDNEGQSYRAAGGLSGHPNNYLQDWTWRSLGVIRQPGRVFKITDDGLFTRLDGLEINYDDG